MKITIVKYGTQIKKWFYFYKPFKIATNEYKSGWYSRIIIISCCETIFTSLPQATFLTECLFTTYKLKLLDVFV